MPIHFAGRLRLNSSLSQNLSSIALFLTLAYAAFDTVWSIYIDSFLHNAAYVGFISSGLTFLSVILFFMFTPVIEKASEKKTWVFSALGLVMVYIFFSMSKVLWVVLLVALFFVVFRTLHIETRGIIISHSCKKKDIGKTEGMFWAIRNIGWLLGPLLAGFISIRLGINSVFLFCALFALIGIVLFNNLDMKKYLHKSTETPSLRKSFDNFKSFFGNKKLRQIYLVSGGMTLYWGIMYIYAPLYIIRSGLPGYMVGVFLFSMTLPLVLFEYLIGKKADETGYKKFLVSGYLILSVFSLLAFLMPNTLLTLIMLVFGSIGASFLEGTRESYFFRSVRKKNIEKYYGSYRTHAELFSTIGKLIAACLLLFFTLKYLFLFLSIEMFIFTLCAIRLKEIIET